MPILAIDKFGNYYETDPDDSDGNGCKGVVPTSKSGDVTIDGSVQRAEAARQHQTDQAKLGFASYDLQDQVNARNDRQLKALKNKASSQRNFMLNTPQAKALLQAEGLKQGKVANYNTDANLGLSGNGMSSNGLYGRAGMPRQQMGVEIALGLAPMPTGNMARSIAAPVTSVGKAEREQYRLNEAMKRRLSSDALEKARLNKLEEKYDQPEYVDRQTKAIMDYERSQKQMVVERANAAVSHPLMNVFKRR